MRIHQATGLRQAARRGKPGESLGIVSGKGGVGKSTLALNLALAAAEQGVATLLVDGDAGLANQDLLMGLAPSWDLSDYRAGAVALQETLCAGPMGLRLLVVGEDGKCGDALAAALARRGDAELQALLSETPLSVFDLGAGIGSAVLDVAQRCRRVWLVATPEPTSLADAYATAKRLWARSPELAIELIVNRSPDRATAKRTHQALDRLTKRFLDRGLPLRGVLPEDSAMRGAVLRQKPLLLDAPRSVLSTRLRSLAESFLEEAQAPSAPFSSSSSSDSENQGRWARSAR
ncbi:MAG: P-loop NTPase [Myxococcota bacterium]